MQPIRRLFKQLRVNLFSKRVCFFTIIVIVLNTACALSRTSSGSLLSSCEKNIHLYDRTSEKVVSNKADYTIHYKYIDKFPSKKYFTELQQQLVECGWKPYNAFEFVVNDADWTSYLEGHTDKETVVVHRFARTYINKSEDKVAVILIRYISNTSTMKKMMMLDKPNNDMQLITLQFMPFNEKEYRQKLDKYKK